MQLTRAVRDRIREQRNLHARSRMQDRHVEFCTECGRACDRTGRRNMSTCYRCQRADT